EQRLVVKKGQLHGKKLIANVAGVETRNQADELAGFEIHVAKAALPVLDEGDFYWFQLEGLDVVNRDGQCFGKVGYMMETGANDVMVVRPTDESIDNEERLIPYVDGEVVLKVDREAGKILIDWQADF
ncbi:MAG: ribosome maturation factor RimM, partial [Pseudomonadales bacterium]|nr:ribosome maturation factor RimM [Pseudomonadales bacterium]